MDQLIDMINWCAESSWGCHEIVTELEVPDTCGGWLQIMPSTQRYQMNFAAWQTKIWAPNCLVRKSCWCPNPQTISLPFHIYTLGSFGPYVVVSEAAASAPWWGSPVALESPSSANDRSWKESPCQRRSDRRPWCLTGLDQGPQTVYPKKWMKLIDATIWYILPIIVVWFSNRKSFGWWFQSLPFQLGLAILSTRIPMSSRSR